jgi:GDP-L-fucose synthase
MSWLADKRIAVTGGAGFLGKFVIKELEKKGCRRIFVPRHQDYNLVAR